MKTIKTQVDYTTKRKEIQLKMDGFEAEKIIPANDSVRLLDEITEGIDYRELLRAYSRIGRKPATNPITLFKILVYANMEGIYSSRDIERACKRDINFIWLLGEETAPNHNEIARFRSKRLTDCCEGLFYQLVKLLGEREEIKYEHLFVDGTKIEANANKYSFVWQKSTNKYQDRLNGNIEKFIAKINQHYGIDYTKETDLSELYNYLSSLKKESFVYGRGKRKSELQKDIEALQEYMKRQKKYIKYNETFKGRNSFSKTDIDATFMHMKDDHMRNAQLKPGYNLQIGVEGEYITVIDISSERSDQLTLIPLLEKMDQKLGIQYKDVTADAGYESEENYTYFENKSQTCYIKPQNYERSKTRKFKSNMSLRENMAYDKENDEYTCQNGKKLRSTYVGKRISKSGFQSEITYYECENCEGCKHKKSCTKSKGNRKMQLSKKFLEQRQQSLENITSPKGILLRTNRSIQVEGAFGVIKQDYGFQQFLLRGNKKVMTEILLVALGYNINKLHNKIQQNRTGSQIHEKVVA